MNHPEINEKKKFFQKEALAVFTEINQIIFKFYRHDLLASPLLPFVNLIISSELQKIGCRAQRVPNTSIAKCPFLFSYQEQGPNFYNLICCC